MKTMNPLDRLSKVNLPISRLGFGVFLICNCLTALPAESGAEIDFEHPSSHPSVSGYSAYNPGNWRLQSDRTHDGTDALESGNLVGGWSAEIVLNFSGPGVLSFWWTLPFGEPTDFFQVTEGGTLPLARISGAMPWRRQEIALGPGTHEIKWRCFMDWQVLSSFSARPAFLDEVRFTPADPSHIFFTSDRDGNNEIYRLDYAEPLQTDGSNPVNISNHPANDSSGSLSPDGSKIVFISDRDGNDELYVMNADGSNPVRLTNDLGRDTFPAWSPGGSRIAFVSDRLGRPNLEIYAIDPDGSNLARLTNQPLEDNHPSWSPDGTQIVFDSGFGNTREVYVMDSDGSNLKALTANSAADLSPAFSPDGTQIAFDSNRDGNNEIYVMNADGSNQQNLTNRSEEDTDPNGT